MPSQLPARTLLTTLEASTDTTEVVPAVVRVREAKSETNWKLAFVALAMLTCTGFVSSHDLSRYINFVRENAGDEAADFLVKLVNSTRSKWMQDFMG